MDDFRIDPPLVVNDTPKPQRLASLAEARAFVGDAIRLGSAAAMAGTCMTGFARCAARTKL
jgi:hypothetical protein